MSSIPPTASDQWIRRVSLIVGPGDGTGLDLVILE